MPTIFKRLTHLRKTPILTLQQKTLLGRLVCTQYHSQQIIKKATHRVLSKEPEGEFYVQSYPRLFVPEIDRIIEEYYSSLPQPKIRKRIPSKPVLQKSVKPLNTQK